VKGVREILERLRKLDRPSLVVRPEPDWAPGSVALLSGSFDPVTVAHVALAEAASRLVDLVVLVYSVRTLPKEGPVPPPLLSEEERLEAVERVCAARGFALGLCSRGLLADQVVAAAERFPGAALWLVAGSDKVLQLLDPRWYADRDRALEELFSRAGVLYAVRAGDEGRVEEALRRQENERWRGRFRRLDVAPAVAAVSSREVRERVARGEDPRDLVPPEAWPLLPAPGPPGGGLGPPGRGNSRWE
jgi:nicotinamide-nucleotide adenylyltransferase